MAPRNIAATELRSGRCCSDVADFEITEFLVWSAEGIVRAAADVLKICMYAAVAGEELRFAPRRAKRHSYQSNGEWLGWALAGALVLVALSYWIGSHSAKPDDGPNPAATVIRLPPEPRPPQPKGSHS